MQPFGTVETIARQRPGTARFPASNYPLFFNTPRIVTYERHRNAVLPYIGRAFARRSNFIPLTLADIPYAAIHYPIVFTLDEAIMPLAVVGLEQENYFIDKAGKWMERTYIPTYVRKYPFLLAADKQKEKFKLCVDEDALIFDENAKGYRLYENGRSSAHTRNALGVCAIYQEQYQATREFCEELKQMDMFTEQQSTVELVSGRRIELSEFQLMNPDIFKCLSGESSFDWYKRGFTEFTCHILKSYSNWKNLLRLANTNETAESEKYLYC